MHPLMGAILSWLAGLDALVSDAEFAPPGAESSERPAGALEAKEEPLSEPIASGSPKLWKSMSPAHWTPSKRASGKAMHPSRKRL